MAPKPPPTSGAMKRTSLGSTPSARATWLRLMWMFWLETWRRVAAARRIELPDAAARLHRVHRRCGGCPARARRRGPRWRKRRRRAVASPVRQSRQTLPGTSAAISGAPAARAASPRGHGGQRLVVDVDQLGGVAPPAPRSRPRPAPPARRRTAPCRAASKRLRREGEGLAGLRCWPRHKGAAASARRPRRRPPSAPRARRRAARRAALSIERMRAWACGERSTTA